MNLCDVLKKCLAGNQTGQLVVKFQGVDNLCKISIDRGYAVYITLGNMTPDETIDYIIDKVPEKANFIPGVSPRHRLDQPLNDTLCAISETQHHMSAAPAAKPAAAPSQAAAPPAGNGPAIDATKVSAAIDDFIDLVGPLGTMLAKRSLAQLGYSSVQNMAGSHYEAFIKGLCDEIPEGQKSGFASRYLSA